METCLLTLYPTPTKVPKWFPEWYDNYVVHMGLGKPAIVISEIAHGILNSQWKSKPDINNIKLIKAVINHEFASKGIDCYQAKVPKQFVTLFNPSFIVNKLGLIKALYDFGTGEDIHEAQVEIAKSLIYYDLLKGRDSRDELNFLLSSQGEQALYSGFINVVILILGLA